MRGLFTDTYNSFFHFFFGVCSYFVPLIIPVFVTYQLLAHRNENTLIDLLEFTIGLVLIISISYSVAS
jgi:hypothetical protein